MPHPEFGGLTSPAEAFETVVNVSFRCKCRVANKPVILRGVECLYGCPHCGTVYVILGMSFDRRKGQRYPVAEIGIATHLQGQISGLTFEREVHRERA